MSFEKGLLDRLLGAGRLVVESAGEHGQIVLRDIPHVADVQATLFRLVEDEQRGSSATSATSLSSSSARWPAEACSRLRSCAGSRRRLAWRA